MGYLSIWKVLEEIVKELRKKDSDIPPTVMNYLKSAYTVIKMLESGAVTEESVLEIEQSLNNVESYLVSEGLAILGKEWADKRLRELREAREKTEAEEKIETARFIPGLPREQRWVRVKPSRDLPLAKLKTTAEESGLSHRAQPDGSLIVRGKEEGIKTFIKHMTSLHKQDPKKLGQ